MSTSCMVCGVLGEQPTQAKPFVPVDWYWSCNQCDCGIKKMTVYARDLHLAIYLWDEACNVSW